MAKIIDIKTRQVLADLPTEHWTSPTAQPWRSKDAGPYQFKFYAIAYDGNVAKALIDRMHNACKVPNAKPKRKAA